MGDTGGVEWAVWVLYCTVGGWMGTSVIAVGEESGPGGGMHGWEMGCGWMGCSL